MRNRDGVNAEPKTVVLVVESEAVIRMTAALAIKEAGYAVLAASDADEALAILEARNDIGAVFAEIRLPGHLNGLELGRAVVQRWPPVQMILTSSGRRWDGVPSDWHYVQKPYWGSQITDALRALVPLPVGFVD